MKFQYCLLFLAFGLSIWLNCDIFEPEEKTGGIAIQIEALEQEGPSGSELTDETIATVRCVVYKGDRSVHKKNYDKKDTSFHIDINDLVEGDDYSIQLFGRNSYGCIVRRAEKDSIRVNTDQVTTVQMEWQENVDRGTVTDIDGNVYVTIKIGDQWWTAQNLIVTRYRNGDPIPEVTNPYEWEDLRTGARCIYDNDPSNAAIYGFFYNWHAVNDDRGLAPEGWHVPTEEDWKQLEISLGVSPSLTDEWGFRGGDEGAKMKTIGAREIGTGLWPFPNDGATNETCFSALPSGWRIYTGAYYSFGDAAAFWSSTEHDNRRAWSRSLNYRISSIFRSFGFKERGFSIRCVKD